MTIDEVIKQLLNEAEKWESLINGAYRLQDRECAERANNHRQLVEWLKELKEAKRLLKLAINDFAKLDRENTRFKNCMMPEMDCADCPLSWDSVDDRVEPCHSWRYADEALKLIQNS